MKNIDDVLSNYDRIISIIANKYLESIITNNYKINKVFNILSDDESKYLYGQELLMCIFRNYLNEDKASTFSGLMSKKEFSRNIEKAKQLYPEMASPNNTQSIYIANYCKAATFILEQYKYKDIVKVENDDICLDIGACLGDTAIYMSHNGASNIYAFEIDNTNIQCMKKTFSNLKINSIHITDKAIHDTIDILYYTPSPTNIGGGRLQKIK